MNGREWRVPTRIKGIIALGKVIADLTQKGYAIFLPLCDLLRFDLIAYRERRYYRIQVKYTSNGHLRNGTSWGDSKGCHRRRYSRDDFDYYAAYLPDLDIVVTDDARRRSYAELGGRELQKLSKVARRTISRPTLRKVVWPGRDELRALLWNLPTTKIAARYAVSDKAVAQWARKYDLEKPPRGYWAKQRSLRVKRIA